MPPSTLWQSPTSNAPSSALSVSTNVLKMMSPVKQPAEQTTHVALSLQKEWTYQPLAPQLPNRPEIQSHPHPHPHPELPQQMTPRSIQALEEVRHQHHPVKAGVQTEPKLSRSDLAAHMDWLLSLQVYAEDLWFCCDLIHTILLLMNHRMTVSGVLIEVCWTINLFQVDLSMQPLLIGFYVVTNA